MPSPAAIRIPVAHDTRGRIAVDSTMRSRSHATVWALGDCAAVPGPDGRPYPALAQHASREARHLARNIAAIVRGHAPTPFVFRSLGTMVALGQSQAVAQIFGLRLTGFVASWVRRAYYLFQMPRWDRRLRMVLDWTVAIFFRPDTTKVDLAVEQDLTRRNCAAGASLVFADRSNSSGAIAHCLKVSGNTIVQSTRHHVL